VESFIKEECPVQVPILVLATIIAIFWNLWIPTAACALEEASFKRWTTLPKPTAIGGMLVVVGYVVIRVNKLGAVWNLAPIVGETIFARDNISWPG